MDEHTPGLKRELPDSYLRTMPVGALYELANECDVEPADPAVCDACAAYLIAQEKDRTIENRLAHEFILGATDADHQHPAPLDASGFEAEQRLAGQPTREDWMARAMVAEAAVAELMVDQKRLEKLAGNSRQWLFEPGDRVLCMVSEGTTLRLYAGAVTRVQMPGPVKPEHVVQVQLEDDNTFALGLAWWRPDQVERLLPT